MLISLNLLLEKYKIKPKGIIHIGAHEAEEADVYLECGFNQVIWIEGNLDLLTYLEAKLKNYPTQKAYHALIDVEEKELVFNVTNNLQSSSIYALKEHSTQYPGIVIEKRAKYTTQRLDSFFKEKQIDITNYNFLNIDIQGNELNALKSLGDEIKHFDYIYAEVQVTELYENSHKINQLDAFLFSYGFTRVEMDLKYKSWGDAFYIRKTPVNKLYNLLKLTESSLLVVSWPIRKKFKVLFVKNYQRVKNLIRKYRK